MYDLGIVDTKVREPNNCYLEERKKEINANGKSVCIAHFHHGPNRFY